MQQEKNEVSQESASEQFSYDKLANARSAGTVVFKHHDHTINRAFLFTPPESGYIALSVLKGQPQSTTVSGDQRRLAMLNNRSKTNLPVQQWAQPQQNIQQLEKAGWKFHLSVAQEGDNVKNAWGALVPILLKYKIGETKIVKPGITQDANKVITVYTFSGGPKLNEWEPFVDEVESAFRERNIIPGGQIYEHKVQGSDYIYYRNDKGQNGVYVPDEYKFLLRVVDKIPISEEQRLMFADELNKDEKFVGCIVKSKEGDQCLLQVKTDNSGLPQEFKASLLEDIEDLRDDKVITVSPINNRAAYLALVVPRLDKGIPSTDNKIGAEDPFEKISLTPSKGKDMSRLSM